MDKRKFLPTKNDNIVHMTEKEFKKIFDEDSILVFNLSLKEDGTLTKMNSFGIQVPIWSNQLDEILEINTAIKEINNG